MESVCSGPWHSARPSKAGSQPPKALWSKHRCSPIRSAGRWWIPEITLRAGLKQVTGGSHQDSGPMVSATIPLPVFDRDEPEASRAKAEVQVARNKGVSRGRRRWVRGLWQQAQALTKAARPGSFLRARHFRLALLLSLLNQFSRRERSPSFGVILQSVCSRRFPCWFELNL